MTLTLTWSVLSQGRRDISPPSDKSHLVLDVLWYCWIRVRKVQYRRLELPRQRSGAVADISKILHFANDTIGFSVADRLRGVETVVGGCYA